MATVYKTPRGRCLGENQDGSRCSNWCERGGYCRRHIPTESTPRTKDGGLDVQKMLTDLAHSDNETVALRALDLISSLSPKSKGCETCREHDERAKDFEDIVQRLLPHQANLLESLTAQFANLRDVAREQPVYVPPPEPPVVEQPPNVPAIVDGVATGRVHFAASEGRDYVVINGEKVFIQDDEEVR